MSPASSHIDFSRLVEFVTPYRLVLWLALFLMLATAGLTLLHPWLAGMMTMQLLQGSSPIGVTLDQFILLWLTVLALQAVVSFASQYLLAHTAQRLLSNLRIRIYDHLQILPLAYFHERKRGTVLTLLTHDADQISSFVTGTLLSLLPQLFIMTGTLVMLYITDPIIASIIIALVPLFYLVIRLISRRMRPLSGQLMQEYSNTFAIAEENLNLLPTIKSFGGATGMLKSLYFSE